jgi:hypothetical protein
MGWVLEGSVTGFLALVGTWAGDFAGEGKGRGVGGESSTHVVGRGVVDGLFIRQLSVLGEV